MSFDDSFNDSDEIFTLYSSKNVTETFRTQLKKIVANNKHLTNKNTPQINTEEIGSEKDTNTDEEIQVLITKQEINPAQKTTKEKTGDGSLKTCTGASNEYSPDDSVEIIEEFTPTPTRQSERLRRKRRESNFNFRDASSRSSDPAITRQVNCRRRQKAKKKKQKKRQPEEEIILDDSPQPPEIEDELNCEVSVKVIWKSVNVKKFMIRKFQKLSHIFELLSKEENIATDKIILTFNNVRVHQNDTPDSLNLQVYHFLDGGVLNESTNPCSVSDSNTDKSDGKSVTLKFQDVNKKIVTLNLNKNEKLKVGMIMCSEQLEIPLHKIRFFFDGELVPPSETPETLGLEGGEIIDIKVTDK